MTLSANLILESLPHPVIVVDHENCVRATNPAACLYFLLIMVVGEMLLLNMAR